MAKCWIGFGELSRYHLYIVYYVLFVFLSSFIFSFKDVKDIGVGLFGFTPILRNHPLIQSFLHSIGYILFGFLFYCCRGNDDDNKENQPSRISLHNFSQKILYFLQEKDIPELTDNSHKDLIYKKKNQENNPMNQILLISLYASLNIILSSICKALKFADFDLWIFNIFFTLLFMSYYLNLKIDQYKHQFYSLILVFISNLIILIINTFIRNGGKNSYSKIEEYYGSKFVSIPLFMIYLFFSFIISMARVKAKVLMELKFLSPYKIIIVTGCICLIFSFIALLFSSFFPCSAKLVGDVCKVTYNYTYLFNETDDIDFEDINNNTYLDSIPAYFNNLSNEFLVSKKIFFYELLLVIPSFIFLEFCRILFKLKIIFYFNPIYILVCDSIRYLLQYILHLIFDSGSAFVLKEILTIVADLFSIIGYSIYVELIELRFLGFNDNTKKQIMEREKIETFKIELGNAGLFDDDDDNSDPE